MKIRFEVHCLGFRTVSPVRVAWATQLVAIADDGREKKSIKVKSLDSAITKNVADIMAVTRALQCIKPEYREISDVAIFVPSGYANQILERNPMGGWVMTPKANVDAVEAVRAMIKKYSKLEIRKIEPSAKAYRVLIELLQKQVPDVGMAANQGDNRPTSEGTPVGGAIPGSSED